MSRDTLYTRSKTMTLRQHRLYSFCNGRITTTQAKSMRYWLHSFVSIVRFEPLCIVIPKDCHTGPWVAWIWTSFSTPHLSKQQSFSQLTRFVITSQHLIGYIQLHKSYQQASCQFLGWTKEHNPLVSSRLTYSKCSQSVLYAKRRSYVLRLVNLYAIASLVSVAHLLN